MRSGILQLFACSVGAALIAACSGHSQGNGETTDPPDGRAIMFDAGTVDSHVKPDAQPKHADASGAVSSEGGDGKKEGGCHSATDCDSLVCQGGTCQPPNSHDGVKNDSETDVDCGGSTSPTSDGAPACGDGKHCNSSTDCTSAICSSRICLAPSCGDGMKDGDETDVDCGGSCPACASGKDCKIPKDCQSEVCTNGICQPPSPTDGVKNDSETDVDCGGALLAAGAANPSSDGAPPCAAAKTCVLGSDCAEAVCNANGNMGGGPIDCPAGATCACQAPSDSDGVMNDSETDVDCGGGGSPMSDGAPPCNSGQHCLVASDCSSGVCIGATAASGAKAAVPGICHAPTAADGVANDSETDVDCGGALLADGAPNPASDGAPACATGKKCIQHSDCVSSGCDYSGHCALGPSCTQHHGGDTCGGGEDTEVGPNPTPATGEESCCISLPIAGTSYTVDKYDVTAGRIRAWATRFAGNLRSFTTSIPASNPYWNSAWNPYIPSTEDEVDAQLGPYPAPLTPKTYPPTDPIIDGQGDSIGNDFGQWRDGCSMGKPGAPDGARTWWTAKTFPGDAAPVAYPQDFLDDKIINCIDAYMLTAFCIWDGGHLATSDELSAAWGAGPFPWSSAAPSVLINQSTQMPSGTDADGFDASHYVVHEFGVDSMEFEAPYTYNYDPFGLRVDNTYHIAAPGRFPRGAGPYGHMDLAGLSYQVTQINVGTGPRPPPSNPSTTELSPMDNVGTLGSGSWEIHYIGDGAGSVVIDAQPWKPAFWAYWASTGRCAR